MSSSTVVPSSITRTGEPVKPVATANATVPVAGQPSAIEQLVGVRLDTLEGSNAKLLTKGEQEGLTTYFDPKLEVAGMTPMQHLYRFERGKLHDVIVIFEPASCERVRKAVDEAFKPGIRIARNGTWHWQLKQEYADVSEPSGGCQLKLEKGTEDPDPLVRVASSTHEVTKLDHLGPVQLLKPLAAQGFQTKDKKEWIKTKVTVGKVPVDRVLATETPDQKVTARLVVSDPAQCKTLRDQFSAEWGEPHSTQERAGGTTTLEWMNKTGLLKVDVSKGACAVSMTVVREPKKK